MVNFADIYRLTLPVVATENLIMAATLLLTYMVKKNHNQSYQLSICFLSLAMLLMSLINYTELFLPVEEAFLPFSMAVVVFAASVELFLLFYSFMALLDQRFVTTKKVLTELLLIVIFTLPPLFLFQIETIFWCWFGLSCFFYLCKFSHNFYLYKTYFLRARRELLDYYSDERDKQILWINNVFYTVVIIGTVSIVVPLTNYVVLSFYNLFLFFAYFYLYFEMFRHESLFEESQQKEVVDAREEDETREDETEKEVSEASPSFGLMAGRKELFEQWMANRSYTRQRITIEDVAHELKTSRTRLSGYLNSELHVTFYEWISSLRMEEAKRLLVENPIAPILEIAIQVGIDDRSNFDKLFKRFVGMSPVAYRKSAFGSDGEVDHPNGISN